MRDGFLPYLRQRAKIHCTLYWRGIVRPVRPFPDDGGAMREGRFRTCRSAYVDVDMAMAVLGLGVGRQLVPVFTPRALCYLWV